MLKSNLIAYAFNIAANGTYCQVLSALPQNLSSSGVYDASEDMFDSGQYLIRTGSGVSAGSVAVNLLELSPAGSPVWDTATTPNSPTGAAFLLIPTLAASTVYNGSLGVSGGVFFPAIGIRLIVAGLTGGNIASMQLFLTKR